MLKKWRDNKFAKEKKQLVNILAHNGLIILIILSYMILWLDISFSSPTI